MSRDSVTALDDVLKDPVPFFEAAKSNGQVQARDAEGTYVLTYQRDGGKPDAREFLARGGRETAKS